MSHLVLLSDYRGSKESIMLASLTDPTKLARSLFRDGNHVAPSC